MKEAITFADVLIIPKYSTIPSRKEVDISSIIADQKLELPVISSNMDTITGSQMATAMKENGGIGCLHRFMSIEDNVKAIKESPQDTWCSVGIGKTELERAEALYNAGCNVLVLDVAHGAAEHVANQVCYLNQLLGQRVRIIVGNFATAESIRHFEYHTSRANAYKVGIGGGSMCTTRIVTGCGIPTLYSVMDCVTTGKDIIADGGISNSGDVAKAIVAGAKAVMVGSLLAGTEETPGQLNYNVVERIPEMIEWYKKHSPVSLYKQYRGSASKESYAVQGKDESWRSAEGESTTVPYKGPVQTVLQQISGGLKSAYSYVGAKNTKEFQELAEFIRITNAGYNESRAHGKKD